MINKVKEKVAEFFKDPYEEALAESWNKALNDYGQEIKRKKKEYSDLEEEYWSMNEKQLLKEIAVNTLHIRRHLELND